MKSKFLTGLLVGAAAGAILAILFAPDKGSETRKKLAKKGEDLKEGIREKLDALSDLIKEKSDISFNDENSNYQNNKEVNGHAG